MPGNTISSRERMINAIKNKASDYIPLSFMIFASLRDSCSDMYEFFEKQVELGLDAAVDLPITPLRTVIDYADAPGLPIRIDSRVKIKEWKEEAQNEQYPILHKEYHTPVGMLSTAVNKTEDWPYQDHVPFLDDYLVPRSRKFLIGKKEDLKALHYLLTPVSKNDISEFRENAKRAKKIAGKHGLLLRAGRGYGIELSAFLCGMVNTLLYAMDDEAFVHELAELIFAWNRERLNLFLDEGIDLFMRSGWYESTDTWSPGLYRKFIYPYVKKEIEITHQAGACYGYLMTSGQMPLVDYFIEMGLDVLIGVDPVQGKGMNMSELKNKTRGKICLWGGVNGFITIERGSPPDVRNAVVEAICKLGPEGFILSPVDNVRDNSKKTWDNIQTLIKTWREMRKISV